MATVVNTRDVLLLAASPRLLWTGIQGVKVAADSTTFKVNTAGTPTPSTITLTATLNGISGTVTWSTTLGTATVVGSGTSVTLPYANLSSNVATIAATVVYGGITYRDTITISKVVDGATGATGATGSAGATGTNGDASRIAYTLVNGFSLASSPSSATVSGDSKPNTGTWGETNAWQNTPPVAGVGQSVFQTTGTYSSVLNNTVWVTPYLSNLKVGNLSAITVNTGTLTVDSSGHIKGGQSSYNSGNGFWLGNDGGIYKFSIGNTNTNFTYNGSVLTLKANNGNCVIGDSSLQPTFAFNRTSATTLPSILVTDTSSATSAMLVVQNDNSFAGDQLVSFAAQKGEALRATTRQSTQYTGVFQNLGGTTTALAIAGSTYSGFAGAGDGAMNIADGYLPFTGCHVALVEKTRLLELGDIVCDNKVIFKIDVSNTITEVVPSSRVEDKSVIGVYSGDGSEQSSLDISKKTWYNLTQKFNIIHINSVGEGMLNVCGENGDLEAGDLITTSSTLGKGMKQDDDIIRNYTVAKVRENVKFDSKDQVKLVACIYLCG